MAVLIIANKTPSEMAELGKTPSHKRSVNWRVEEHVLLMDLVNQRREVLFGSFKGSGKGGSAKTLKKAAWQEICNLINA